MKFHEIAETFPLLPEGELKDLSEKIRENGLRDSIATYEGEILDGRNRYLACKQAGVKPRFEEFQGTWLEALAFSEDKNDKRRHMSSSQRAVANAKRVKLHAKYAAEIDRMKAEAKERQRKGGEEAGRSRPKKVTQRIEEPVAGRNARTTDAQRARDAGTNRAYIAQADQLVAESPELAQKVLAGEISLPAAAKINEPQGEEESGGRQSRGVGVARANEAINCLRRIPKNDPFRKRGFQIVKDWIRRHS